MRPSYKSVAACLLSASLVACSATPDSSPQTQLVSRAAVPVIHAASHPANANGPITLEKIMSDPDWIGRQPSNAYWADDSQHVFYERKREGQPINDLFRIAPSDTDNGQRVELEQLHQVAYNNRVFNRDKTKAAWQFEGNLFVKDLVTGKVRQLSQGNIDASQILFLNNGNLAYQSGDQFFSLDLTNGFTGLLVQWSFEQTPEANDKPADYIAEQQQKLIGVVKQRRTDRQTQFNHQYVMESKNATTTKRPVYLPQEQYTVKASLSPNGKWLVLATSKPVSERDDSDIMPSYVNEDGRIEAQPARQRVADAEAQNYQLWLVDITQNKVRPLSYNSLPGYNDDVLAQVRKENASREGKSYQVNRLPRDIVLMDDWYWNGSSIQWHNSGEQVAVMLEAWDNKDRWLATVDLQDAKLVNQDRLHDDAWINYRFNSFGWFNQSQTLYYLSEKSGYANLYMQQPGKKAQALVSGAFEVDSLTVTHNDSYVYYKANVKHPGIYDIYRVDTKSGAVEQLTDLKGKTDYQLSPDESKLLLTHSKLVQPPELYIQNAKTGVEATRLTHTISDEFLALPWTAPDVVPVPSSHTQQPVFARVYYPKDYKQGEPRKAVMFTHGAGYLQNSHLGWSDYYHEFMFHSLLAQQGYVVMDMDYRASRGYGRDWRTAIYRHMGKPEVEDLRDGVNWLVDNANVDRNRVGTYGGSYGGFLTYMSLFTAPDLFQAGAALRPVSDWAHYNHGYTSNILNMPDTDPIAYERSSPIYFAEGLQKPLLINAPMVDSNVFFVDTVRLVQRLIELKKDNFETALFPVESHGFVEPTSWLDEYKRIYKLFEQNL
ncbi:S9 family peptidase [Neptunicella marina]|uniref:Prolyl oligopeptidase family serine peptidase n=1 Tax=Neptunicella marina TaxID=2125989 RepID=A0A8J6LZ34_9ALTE|nr:prolyl oligopeptidase family serine peptidase [Neptunicella marina]MBC3766419.1 prolyl oligopeptidase family serine peptidase [Neptunicella marina]